MNKSITYLYFLLLTVDLIALFTDMPVLHALAKSGLMPLLLLFASFHQDRTNKIITALSLALLFSWVGDILLLFDKKAPLFFIAGLAMFLAAHIAYIYLFTSAKKLDVHKKRTWPVLIPVIAYTVLFISFLYPYLGNLRIPVIVYATVLSTMFYQAGTVYSFSTTKGKMIASGAFLFLLSDSLLAMNKFYAPFPLAPQAVILTYALAQWLITFGITDASVSLQKH
jgi:uncharacterized membrane protein YhhN